MKKEVKLVDMPVNKNVMRFNVYLPNVEKPMRVQVERMKSGAFSYGNGTCVSIEVDGRNYQTYDTRYLDECSTVEGYREFFAQKVREMWEHDGQVVEQIL